MLRRTAKASSFFQVLKEELAKIPAMFRHDLKATERWLTNEDLTDKEKKIRKAHQELEALDRERERAAAAKMTWAEKLSALKNDMRHAFSTKSATVALVQHCARAHMAEVAVELGIDVRNVNIVTETASVTEGTKVVGYIEAPNASREEVMAFAAKLQKACPAAAMHGEIEWRQLSHHEGYEPEPKSSASESPSASSSSTAARYEPGRSVSSPYSSSPASDSERTSLSFASNLRDDGDDDNFSLPFTGMQREKKSTLDTTMREGDEERVMNAAAGSNTTSTSTSTDTFSGGPVMTRRQRAQAEAAAAASQTKSSENLAAAAATSSPSPAAEETRSTPDRGGFSGMR